MGNLTRLIARNPLPARTAPSQHNPSPLRLQHQEPKPQPRARAAPARRSSETNPRRRRGALRRIGHQSVDGHAVGRRTLLPCELRSTQGYKAQQSPHRRGRMCQTSGFRTRQVVCRPLRSHDVQHDHEVVQAPRAILPSELLLWRGRRVVVWMRVCGISPPKTISRRDAGYGHQHVRNDFQGDRNAVGE